MFCHDNGSSEIRWVASGASAVKIHFIVVILSIDRGMMVIETNQEPIVITICMLCPGHTTKVCAVSRTIERRSSDTAAAYG